MVIGQRGRFDEQLHPGGATEYRIIRRVAIKSDGERLTEGHIQIGVGGGSGLVTAQQQLQRARVDNFAAVVAAQRRKYRAFELRHGFVQPTNYNGRMRAHL